MALETFKIYLFFTERVERTPDTTHFFYAILASTQSALKPRILFCCCDILMMESPLTDQDHI